MKNNIYKNICYKRIATTIGSIPVIVWVDIDAKKSFGNISQSELFLYLEKVLGAKYDKTDTSYLIIYAWTMESNKMLDVWKYTVNTVDVRSGPLVGIKLYKEGEVANDDEIASGNTLVILGQEELCRRGFGSLQEYLELGKPELPFEMESAESF